MSKGWVSQSHDYKQLRHEFPADQLWFNDLSVSLDLGYQGFRKDYDCQLVNQPAKKPRNAELSAGEKAVNQQISSGRIYPGSPLGLRAGKIPRFGLLPVVNQSGVHYRAAEELDLCTDSVPTLF